MIFYFTATGNSLYAAKELDNVQFSIAQEIHSNMIYTADKIGIVCPVFGHEMPEFVREFIRRAEFHTDYLYLILTYGNRHGGAAELADEFIKSVGKQFDYINILLMADNFLPGFDMNEQRKIDKHVDSQIAVIRKELAEKVRKISEVTESDRTVHKALVERNSRMPADAFKKLYHITGECIGCGICTRICPMACFSVTKQHAEWNPEQCIACMACIHACPELAIQLNMPEPNPRARYRNEHIKLTEIISANNQTSRNQ